MYEASTTTRDPQQSGLAVHHLLGRAVSRMDWGWVLLRDVLLPPDPGRTSSSPLRVCFALLHPERGIALLDLEPKNAPDAVGRLRQVLAAAGFQSTFAGHLPIVYRRLTQEEIPHLGDVVDAAFGEEESIRVLGGHAWIGLARQVVGGERVFAMKLSVTETQPKVRSPGFRALGYFWLAVLAVAAGSAGFLQYMYIPPVQAADSGNTVPSSAPGAYIPTDLAETTAPSPALAELQTVAALQRAAEPDPSPAPIGDEPSSKSPPALRVPDSKVVPAPPPAALGKPSGLPEPADADRPPATPPRLPDVPVAATAKDGPATTPKADPAPDHAPEHMASPAAVPDAATPAPVPDSAASEATPPVPAVPPPGPAPDPAPAAPAAQVQTVPAPDSAASAPRATPSPGPPAVNPSLAEMMVRRGDALLREGDVSAARLLYDRAAAAGSGRAATAMGKTFDAAFLAGIGVVGLSGDPALAATWYRRGAELGDEEARTRLQALPPATGRSSPAQERRP